MRIKKIIFVLILSTELGYSQSWESEFSRVEAWRFPNSSVSGFIWDAEVDSRGRVAIMFFRDGIKLVSQNGVKDLAPYGQGPSDIERWMALAVEGSYLVDVEASGKLKYFKQADTSYAYEKEDWLFIGNDFPLIKAAVRWGKKWYLSGFSSVFPQGEEVKGYFISVFDENRRQIKRVLYRNFKGAFRGPTFLTVHIRLFADRIWAMLESEPVVYVFRCENDTLERTIKLDIPQFYRPIPNYWPFENGNLSKIKSDYEKWLLSYSRIENLRINEENLIMQLRTADQNLPKFALLFYKLKDLTLEKVFYTPHYFLTENSGRYYFFENGDPGLDDQADNINILVYKKR